MTLIADEILQCHCRVETSGAVTAGAEMTQHREVPAPKWSAPRRWRRNGGAETSCSVQSHGPAAAKLWSPNRVLVRGTQHVSISADQFCTLGYSLVSLMARLPLGSSTNTSIQPSVAGFYVQFSYDEHTVRV